MNKHMSIPVTFVQDEIHRVDEYTYETNNSRCLRYDVFLCYGPTIAGGIQANNAQILQEFTVRFEDDASFIYINGNIGFGPLETARACRQRFRPCRFNVR